MTYLEWLQLHLRYDAREQQEMRMLVVKISINLPHLTKRCNHLIATNAPVTEMRNPHTASIFYLVCAFSNSRVHLSSGTHTDTWPRYQSKRKEEGSIICTKSIRRSVIISFFIYWGSVWDHHLMELISLRGVSKTKRLEKELLLLLHIWWLQNSVD